MLPYDYRSEIAKRVATLEDKANQLFFEWCAAYQEMPVDYQKLQKLHVAWRHAEGEAKGALGIQQLLDKLDDIGINIMAISYGEDGDKIEVEDAQAFLSEGTTGKQIEQGPA